MLGLTLIVLRKIIKKKDEIPIYHKKIYFLNEYVIFE